MIPQNKIRKFARLSFFCVLAGISSVVGRAENQVVDLIIVSGQSNAVGFDAVATQLPEDRRDAQVMFWWRGGATPADQSDSTFNQQWVPLQTQSRGNQTMSRDANFASVHGGFGPEMGFVRTLMDAEPARPLAIVKVAYGGTSINAWVPGASLHSVLMSELNQAMAQADAMGITLRPRAFLWCQGETDGNRGMETHVYRARLESLLARLRSDLDAPEMIALLGFNTRFGSRWQTRTQPRAEIQKIRQAQIQVAENSDYAIHVEDWGCQVVNSAHFGSAGTLELGERYAAALLQTEVALGMLDIPRLVVVDTGEPTTVTEGGESDTYIVTLNRVPDADVVVSLAVDDQVTVSPTSLTFTPGNWNVPQVVTVTAVDDDVHELIHTGTISHTSSSSEPTWNGLSQDFAVTVICNDNTPPEVDAGADLSLALVPGERVPIIPGASINLDPGANDGTHSVWQDSTGLWNLTWDSSVTLVPDVGSSLPGITSAFAFPGGGSTSGGAEGPSLTSLNGAHRKPITLEFWFKPNASASYTSIGQILWETGGRNGIGVFYRDGVVSAALDNNRGSISANVSDLTDDFIHLVVTYDNETTFNNFNLYINGVRRQGRGWPNIVLSDGNAAGLGKQGGSQVGGAGGLSGATHAGYDGMIAIFRSYHGRAFTAGEVFENYDAIVGLDSVTVTLNGTATDPDDDLLNTKWTVVSGPGPVFFPDASDPQTTATFRTVGTYVLRLSADDTLDQAHDEMTITVLEAASLVVTHIDGDTTVTEGGDSDTYTVVLNRAPEADVLVTMTVDEQVTVSPTSLTFTTSNWDVPRAVTVTAVDDDLHELIHTGTITHTSSSSDPLWNGLIQEFVVTIIDNDNTAPEVNAGANQTVALTSGEPWAPEDLPLAAWYDAADESTITKDGSDRVSQWRDRSGNGHHVNQSSDGSKPRSGTRTLNGLNSLAFSGSANQFLRSTVNISAQPLTAFAVAQFDSAGSNSTVFDGAGTARCMLRRRSTDDLAIFAGSWMAGPATTAEAVLASVEFQGANSTIRKNGGTAVTGNPGSGSLASGLTIGNISGNPGESWRMDGLISELIFVSGSFSDAERQRLEGYLAHKWGLQANLPAEHPYQTAEPTTASGTVILAGTATDADGDPLVTTWSVVSGPGTVTFADSSAVTTTAEFSAVGTYVLRLAAFDGQDTSFDEVTITVMEGTEKTYFDWISGFGLSERSGFDDDYNRDGVSNGLKFFFGIDPREPSPGLSIIAPEAASPSQFSFTHPMAEDLPATVHGAYRWTKDLATFHGDGATDEDGTGVTFVRSEPIDGRVTVTATINGTPTDRIFVTLVVTLDE